MESKSFDYTEAIATHPNFSKRVVSPFLSLSIDTKHTKLKLSVVYLTFNIVLNKQFNLSISYIGKHLIILAHNPSTPAAFPTFRLLMHSHNIIIKIYYLSTPSPSNILSRLVRSLAKLL